MEEHVMPTGSGYLAGPLSLHLTDHVCQVETTVRMSAGSLTHDLDGVNRRYRGAAQKGDRLGDRGNTKDPNAFNEFRLSGLAQWDDYPGERPVVPPEWRAKRRGRVGDDHPAQARLTGLFRVVLRI
mgnify:CR=1 FL=1